MSDPLPDPGPAPPAFPEIQPDAVPEEAPLTTPSPQEDDTGRPHDGGQASLSAADPIRF